MHFTNIIDDKGRFVELKTFVGATGQVDSHTYSYLEGRNARRQVGMIMGFEADPFSLEFYEINELYKNGQLTEEQTLERYRNLIKSTKSRN